MRMRSQPTKRRESRGCPESPPADTRWIGPAALKEGAQIRASASPSDSGRCAASYTRSQQRDHMPLASFDEAAIQPTAKVAYQQWIGEREPAQAEQAQQQLLLLRHVHLQLAGDGLERRPKQAQMSARPSRHTRPAQRLALHQRQEVRPLIQELKEVLDDDLERTVRVVRRRRGDLLARLLHKSLGAVEHPLKDRAVERLLGTEEVAGRAAREPGSMADALHAYHLEAQVGEQGFGSVEDRLAAAFGSTSGPRVVQGLANQAARYSITFAPRPARVAVGRDEVGRCPMSAAAAALGRGGRDMARAVRASARPSPVAHPPAPRPPRAAGDSRRPKRHPGHQEPPAPPRPLSSGPCPEGRAGGAEQHPWAYRRPLPAGLLASRHCAVCPLAAAVCHTDARRSKALRPGEPGPGG